MSFCDTSPYNTVPCRGILFPKVRYGTTQLQVFFIKFHDTVRCDTVMKINPTKENHNFLIVFLNIKKTKKIFYFKSTF